MLNLINNTDLNEDTIYESKLSILLKAKLNSPAFSSSYDIEIILMQDAPEIYNYNQLITIVGLNDSNENDSLTLPSNECVYNYTFGIDQNDALVAARFVQLDSSQSDECVARFLISDNGCLSLSTKHFLESDKCANRSASGVILAAGYYHIHFKLCLQDQTNTTKCSLLYNQTVLVETSLEGNSKVRTKSVRHRFTFDDSLSNTKLKVFRLLQNSNQSIILLVLLVTILFIALITILALAYYYFRTRLRQSEKKNFCEKALVLPPSSCETSSDSGMTSQMHSSSNTPETSSNVTTNSSKISKLDDEVCVFMCV